MTKYLFALFVTGHTSRAEQAVQTVRNFCEDRLQGDFELQIVDVLEQPELAEEYKIMATPTLVRQTPEPKRRYIGNLREIDLVSLETTELEQLCEKRSHDNG